MTADSRRVRKHLEPGTRVVIKDGPLEGVVAVVLVSDADDVMITLMVRLRDEPLVVEMPAAGVNADATRTELLLHH
jgi:hypothetical protein